jgi:hypothetical protein
MFLTKFFMYNATPRLTGAELTTTFDVVYSTSADLPTTWAQGAVDKVVGHFLVPSNAAGITNEQLVIELGQYLNTLWSRSRSVVSTIQYETYKTNVPYYYKEDVYQIDPTTGSAISIVNGAPKFTILHHKGDPVLNPDGSPSYQHKAGDVILDGANNPIPTNPRGVSQQLDIMMIDATYRFATDSVAATYVQQLVTTVVGWLMGSFETMNEQLLENTSLYYYPVANMGTVRVYGPDGLIYNVDAGQKFTVTCLVPKTVFNNDALKQQLQATTIATIAAQLKSSVVSDSSINSALTAAYGSDVVSFIQSGLGGSLNLNTMTLLDQSTQLGIAKQLVANADGSLTVQEAVTVSFVAYNVATS